MIIPAHNEEARLPTTLEIVGAFLHAQSYSAEVLIVENGSSDRTLEIAQEYAGRMSFLKVIHEEQAGKGRAVKRGMLEARGEYRFFADADFSMPIEEINRFLPPALDGVDVVIGSREAEGAVRYDEPAFRHFTGRVFNTLVRFLALPGLKDSQCGFKCFRGAVAEDVFPYQTIEGWTFDVEVLFIARKRGYKIVEIGVPWYFDANSKVRVFKQSLKMATDLLSIRRNALQGIYNAAAKP
ncbi:MAG: glycosyltransferase family 2 protein [Anaerolineaceae bacterium]|nr:glycosyltransferase family 2 protein [Anaerolineaceae bacterium]